jgi:hypothetical protein
MDWLEEAYDDHDYNLFYTIGEPDLPIALKKTVRWQRAPLITAAVGRRARWRASSR